MCERMIITQNMRLLKYFTSGKIMVAKANVMISEDAIRNRYQDLFLDHSVKKHYNKSQIF